MFCVTAEQMEELARLRKIFDRMQDPSNFAGESKNAHRLLQSFLGMLNWSEQGFRAACGVGHPGL